MQVSLADQQPEGNLMHRLVFLTLICLVYMQLVLVCVSWRQPLDLMACQQLLCPRAATSIGVSNRQVLLPYWFYWFLSLQATTQVTERLSTIKCGLIPFAAMPEVGRGLAARASAHQRTVVSLARLSMAHPDDRDVSLSSHRTCCLKFLGVHGS